MACASTGWPQDTHKAETSKGRMAHPKRFELLTPRFVVWCSIQLSYGCVLRNDRVACVGDPLKRPPMDCKRFSDVNPFFANQQAEASIVTEFQAPARTR